MPPQVNATLTAVNGADAGTGGRDDWDAPAAASTGTTAPTGPLKWTGDEGAYYRESTDRGRGGGGPDVVDIRSLIIDSVTARATGLDTDDVLTFIDPAGVTRHARARRIIRAELDGIPEDLATTRLELEER